LAAWSQRVPVGRSRTVPQASRYAGVRICLDTPSTLTAAHIHQCLRSSFRVTPSVLTRLDWCRNVDLLSIGYRSKSVDLPGALLIPKLRSQVAEFLNERSLVRLGILSPPTCRFAVRTASNFLEDFLGGMELTSTGWPKPHGPASLGIDGPPDLPGHPSYAHCGTNPSVPTPILPRLPIGMTFFGRCRNVDLPSIGYALRPGLRIRLTLRGLPYLRKP
jgi:hypothetical protein